MWLLRTAHTISTDRSACLHHANITHLSGITPASVRAAARVAHNLLRPLPVQQGSSKHIGQQEASSTHTSSRAMPPLPTIMARRAASSRFSMSCIVAARDSNRE